jgi:two-component system phosphate regulon sensor histidine kinase PhoR
VETLKDGAIEDKETAAAFLDIIEKQTKRLDSIIEDLLALSRLEQSNTEITMEAADFSEILDRVFELCLPGARTKASPSGGTARRPAGRSQLDPGRAGGHEPRGQRAQVFGRREHGAGPVSEDGEEILVTVEDDGPGIPSKTSLGSSNASTGGQG